MPLLTRVDTLLDLHAKLATVVRYYDRMLEERLSNTYSQHSLTYQKTPSRLSSSMYPSIPPNAFSNQGGAESYYNMDAPIQSPPFSRSHASHNIHPQSQSFNSHHSMIASANTSKYDMLAAAAGNRPYQSIQHSQRTPGFQGYSQSPVSVQDPSYIPESQFQGYQQQQNSAMQQQIYSPSQPPSQIPTVPRDVDPATAYYTNSDEQALTSQNPTPHISEHSYVPQVSSPERPQQESLEQQQSIITQNLQPSNVQQSQPSTRTRQESWPQSQVYQQQPYQQQTSSQGSFAYPSMHSYTQNSFPSAPQHQPQPKVVEESLIEL